MKPLFTIVMTIIMIAAAFPVHAQNTPDEARGQIINAVDYLISEIQKLEAANAEAQERLDAFGEKIEQFETDLSQVKAENDALGVELTALEGVYEDLENENAKLKALLRLFLSWLEEPAEFILMIREVLGDEVEGE